MKIFHKLHNNINKKINAELDESLSDLLVENYITEKTPYDSHYIILKHFSNSNITTEIRELTFNIDILIPVKFPDSEKYYE